MARTAYSETTWRLGPMDFPMRLVVPFLVSVAMVIGVEIFLTRTFFGRAVLAVGPGAVALRLMGGETVRARGGAFARLIATAGGGGAVPLPVPPPRPGGWRA